MQHTGAEERLKGIDSLPASRERLCAIDARGSMMVMNSRFIVNLAGVRLHAACNRMHPLSEDICPPEWEHQARGVYHITEQAISTTLPYSTDPNVPCLRFEVSESGLAFLCMRADWGDREPLRIETPEVTPFIQFDYDDLTSESPKRVEERKLPFWDTMWEMPHETFVSLGEVFLRLVFNELTAVDSFSSVDIGGDERWAELAKMVPFKHGDPYYNNALTPANYR